MRFAFPSAFVGQWHRKRMRGAIKPIERRRSLTVAGTAQVERGKRGLFPV
jgi:hypothetical protein